MNDIESLKIYKEYMELIRYSYVVIDKVKNEYLKNSIMDVTIKGMENIIRAGKSYKYKLDYLNDLDANLKILKVLVRITYKNKYLSKQNLNAWIRKITNITNMLLGWMSYAQNNKK
jgi:hypothetical protein